MINAVLNDLDFPSPGFRVEQPSTFADYTAFQESRGLLRESAA